MIKYNPKQWFGLIFKFHKSGTLKIMMWVLIAYAIYSGLIVYLELRYDEWFSRSSTQIHSLLGFVIGLFLVFRTNTAYDRWWEGRKQWGALVNNTRNLALKLNAMLPEHHEETKRFFAIIISNYVIALKEHLRNGVKLDELIPEKSLAEVQLETADHIPNTLAGLLHNKIHELYRNKDITGDQLIVLDDELQALTDITGACERIKNTPIPYSYSLFIKKFIFMYTMTMPFGLVFEFKYWTILISTFVLYVFGSIELIAEEIEDPFGNDTNDLPTNELTEKIGQNINAILIKKQNDKA
jgi:putative membrane protein